MAADRSPNTATRAMLNRPGVLSLNIREKAALYAAYMPFLKGGGIFIPTNRAYQLGEEVFMLLSLMDDPQRIAVQGRVVWITPEGVQGNRTQGIGVQFTPGRDRRVGAGDDRKAARRDAGLESADAHDVVVFVDSHCHINFPELAADLPAVFEAMAGNRVTHAMCIGVNLPDLPQVLALADEHANIYASVGVHPDYEDTPEPSVEQLIALAARPKVAAIGETGLDYYRATGDLEWQRQRFRTHIRAARSCGKPLVIHTRSAAADTLAIMRDERAGDVGGVMHCFTETWDVAQGALELGFHISFSGIVTFKNAVALKDVARRVPLDRMLIETDSPYLAPVPYRGKLNQPAYVRYVAEEIARLREVPVEVIAGATSANFFRLIRASAHAA